MRFFSNTVFKISAFFILTLFLCFPLKAFSEKKPSVMFMIAEQNIGQEIFIYWWGLFSRTIDLKAQQYDLSVGETTLKEDFLNAGFNVIDISNVSNKIKVSNAYKIVDITKDAVIEIGKNVGADVVVKGKVIARVGPQNTGSNVGTYMADITATAFQVKDGRILGSGRGHGVSRNISEITGGVQAIERASQKLAEKLINQINRK